MMMMEENYGFNPSNFFKFLDEEDNSCNIYRNLSAENEVKHLDCDLLKDLPGFENFVWPSTTYVENVFGKRNIWKFQSVEERQIGGPFSPLVTDHHNVLYNNGLLIPTANFAKQNFAKTCNLPTPTKFQGVKVDNLQILEENKHSSFKLPMGNPSFQPHVFSSGMVNNKFWPRSSATKPAEEFKMKVLGNITPSARSQGNQGIPNQWEGMSYQNFQNCKNKPFSSSYSDTSDESNTAHDEEMHTFESFGFNMRGPISTEKGLPVNSKFRNQLEKTGNKICSTDISISQMEAKQQLRRTKYPLKHGIASASIRSPADPRTLKLDEEIVQEVIVEENRKNTKKSKPITELRLTDGLADGQDREYLCVFCKSNNEPDNVYKSHPIRVNGILICPYLRNHTCSICKETGHTIKYCKNNRRGFFAMKSIGKADIFQAVEKNRLAQATTSALVEASNSGLIPKITQNKKDEAKPTKSGVALPLPDNSMVKRIKTRQFAPTMKKTLGASETQSYSQINRSLS